MLSENELQGLQDICKRKIENGKNIDEVEKFVKKQHSGKIWQKIYEDVSKYYDSLKEIRQNNQRFWMLISNPSIWYSEEKDFYKVNQNLFELDKDTKEPWKIDDTQDITEKLKEGERGIIKVGEDNRSIKERTDEYGNLVEKLQAGIYGIFEVTKNDYGKEVYKKNGYSFVDVRVIDNFFHENAIIPKEKAIELLGETIYKRMSSGEIDKNLFEKVVKFQKSLKGS